MYDYHRSYEIDKTHMKMLVPLNLNGSKLAMHHWIQMTTVVVRQQ